MSNFKSFIKNMDKNTVLVAIAVVGIVVAGGLIYANSTPGFSLSSFGFGLSKDAVAKKAVDYINTNQLAQGTVTLVSVSEESGLIKMRINLGTSEVDSYVTKDGKLLFPYVYNIDEKKADATANNTDTQGGKTSAEILASITKTDKPLLEAYIVSRCPFGLQMQRMMADAIQKVPALADFFKVRYIGSVSSDGKFITSMHDDPKTNNYFEGKENLRQICIREEQASKYWAYVSCQMKASGTENSCATSTGIDLAKLNSCVSDPSKGVAYAKVDFDLSTKYSVTGSPTLVLNGKVTPESDANRNPVFGSNRSSDEVKTMICSASKTQAGFCSTKLNTAQAATSFSATYLTSASDASGNSGANGTNCAPAQ